MSNITIIIFLLFICIWFYSAYSVFSSKFKEEEAKVFWSIGIVFVPFLAFFYLFMRKDLLK